jgi:hypothetical protein
LRSTCSRRRSRNAPTSGYFIRTTGRCRIA